MVRKIAPALALAALAAACAGASFDYNRDLNKEFVLIHLNEAARLYNEGRYDEAARRAEGALKFASQVFAPDDVDLAVPLDQLALLYEAQGKYAEAEPLFRREM